MSAASRAGIKLTPIRDAFDSSSEIVRRIYRSIQEADIVVSVVQDNNANVLFESGYAVAWDKSILYIAKDGDSVPFDIGNVERFIYRQLDEKDGERLTAAMRKCLASTKAGLTGSRDFVRLRQHLLSTHFSDNLFGKCVSYTFTNVIKWIGSWNSNSNLEFIGAHHTLEIGTFILRNITTGGFVTLYYPGQESWEPDADDDTPDQYFEATREAVKRGCAITRVYVVDELVQINEDTFRQMAREDVAAGIDARFILRSQLPDLRASDFGLWDDELHCEVEYTRKGDERPRLHRCRYWSDEFHLAQARSWKREIEAHAKPCPELPSEHPLLLESVARPQRFDDLCRSVLPGKTDCSAYHLHWQKLRLCNMVSTPNWHADFYADAFRRWAAAMDGRSTNGSLDVLICGLADYSMLYWVVQSLDHTLRDRCVFHVLDICETPLEQCKWLQKKLRGERPPIRIDVKYHRLNIFDNRFPDSSFDLITTDAFLTRFAGAARKTTLISEWLRLLRQGGRIVTTARVQERPEDITPEDRSAFVIRTVERSAKSGLDPEIMKRVAQDYAAFIQSSPFGSEHDVRQLLANSGGRAEIRVSFHNLSDFEMSPANYARIEIERLP